MNLKVVLLYAGLNPTPHQNKKNAEGVLVFNELFGKESLLHFPIPLPHWEGFVFFQENTETR